VLGEAVLRRGHFSQILKAKAGRWGSNLALTAGLTPEFLIEEVRWNP
jgi:hypothetical protein